MTKPISVDAIDKHCGKPFPEPFKTEMGDSHWQALGDVFGLTHLGVNLEELMPGAQSALRHWHSKSDEFLYVLEGELVLINNDGESAMRAGMCIGFKAGEDNGHHLLNRSDKPARFIVVGNRMEGDEVHYPDHDLQWRQQGGRWQACRKNGEPY